MEKLQTVNLISVRGHEASGQKMAKHMERNRNYYAFILQTTTNIFFPCKLSLIAIVEQATARLSLWAYS